MKGSLTEEEWNRILEFTSAHPYEREPDMLVPDGDPENDEAGRSG